MTTRRGDWIQTYTGVEFYPLDPRPEDVNIGDIAHALANICRFTGHCRAFYSVAQHCVLAARYVEDIAPEFAFAALLHDASEAYICDIARPLKRLPEFAGYREAERLVEDAIRVHFGLTVKQWSAPVVKDVDLRMLATEARDLMPAHPVWPTVGEPFSIPITPWTPEQARREFLMEFKYQRERAQSAA